LLFLIGEVLLIAIFDIELGALFFIFPRLLTLVSLHEHGVVLEPIDTANEGNGLAHEVHDLGDPNEWMWLAVHLLDFLCHYLFYKSNL
jgi:hypothetical protein